MEGSLSRATKLVDLCDTRNVLLKAVNRVQFKPTIIWDSKPPPKGSYRRIPANHLRIVGTEGDIFVQ